MIYIKQNILIKSVLFLTISILTGCSSIDSSRISNTTTSNLPEIPEIKRQQVVTQNKPKKAVISSTVETRNSVNRPAQEVETQLTTQQQIDANLKAKQQMQDNATRDIDPFATIPETSSASKVVSTPLVNTPLAAASPAVKSLMVSARADITLGRSRSAVSKLERGLRIEPKNPQLWHMLARAHYTNSAYLHSISIAKKSNSLTNNSDLKTANWNLIKQAGERSGNASAMKEALDYLKVNP